jgi:hypothetical protein
MIGVIPRDVNDGEDAKDIARWAVMKVIAVFLR